MYDISHFLLSWTGQTWLVTLVGYILTTTMILVVGPVGMMLFTWIERRGIGLMQDRKGPNRVGPFGLLQPISEAIKTMTKEDITPVGADRWVHFLAPVVMMASTVLAFAVIPLGKLYPSQINVGVLFIIGVSALHTLGMLMAGWGSNNKFALLGGMRAAAQMISYEIPQVMSLVAIVMWVGSMRVADVINHQSNGGLNLNWHIFTPVGALAALVFFISSLAEGERTPFDIPEADSEIVAGYMTEYSGMKFAVFYLANYMTNLAICAVTAAMFLGGGNGPGTSIPYLGGLLAIIYLIIKVVLLFWFMVVIRATVPRLRVDQLMSFAWKFLLPLALFNIFAMGIWIAVTQWGADKGFGFLNDLVGQPGSLGRTLTAFAVTLVLNAIAVMGALALYRGRTRSYLAQQVTAA
ncbi:MAG: NADH-quinone oxidoreductase subunit NuoH [Herpetosiphonaceae bacterium]|nr:NADH-quinone oxidoreductase subunit NuoH [Herpetosiphonaceae bacterium]